MVTLIIDTSTQFLNIGLMQGQKMIASLSKRVKTNHSEHVMIEIDALLLRAQLTLDKLSAIAVAQGPGSYTGLRIGISVAKMLAYSLNVPLYQFSSLALIALQGQGQCVVPLIDARRQAVYTGHYIDYHSEGDEYMTIAMLIEQLNAKQNPICFVADQVETLLSPWFEQLTVDYQLKTIEQYDLTQFAKLTLVEADAFNMKPSYLRLSEAEANLLKK